MNQEEQLKHLFDMARQEPVETSVDDVQKWIGMGVFVTALALLLSKLKISFTKSFIMYISIASVIGVGITALILSSSSEEKTSTKDDFKSTTSVKSSYQKPIEELEETPQKARYTLFQPLEEMELTAEIIEEIFPIEHVQEMDVQSISNNFTSKEQIITNPGANVLKPFTEVHTSGLFTLILIQGDEYSYRAEGDYNEEDLMIAWDSNQEKGLYINYNSKKSIIKKKSKKNKNVVDDTNVDNLTLYLTFKSIEKLKLSGITKAKAKTPIQLNNFLLSVNGGSTADFVLNAKKLTLETSGVTKVGLASTVENLKINIQGASSVHFDNPMDVEQLDIAISGTSNLTLDCNSIHQNISQQGATTLQLNGNAKHSKIDISGTSNLKITGNTETFNSLIQGACIVSLTGMANEADIKISGTSTFKGSSFTTERSKIEAQGACSVQLTSKTSSKVYASGTSNVKIAGNPTEFESKADGAATIKKI